MRFQAEHDWPQVRAACHALLVNLADQIGDLTGLPPLSPPTPDWIAQMASLPLPGTWGDPARIKARLWDDFRIEVPVMAWNGHTLIRISVQGYTSSKDGERLMAALAAIKIG